MGPFPPCRRRCLSRARGASLPSSLFIVPLLLAFLGTTFSRPTGPLRTTTGPALSKPPTWPSSSAWRECRAASMRSSRRGLPKRCGAAQPAPALAAPGNPCRCSTARRPAVAVACYRVGGPSCQRLKTGASAPSTPSQETTASQAVGAASGAAATPRAAHFTSCPGAAARRKRRPRWNGAGRALRSSAPPLKGCPRAPPRPSAPPPAPPPRLQPRPPKLKSSTRTRPRSPPWPTATREGRAAARGQRRPRTSDSRSSRPSARLCSR